MRAILIVFAAMASFMVPNSALAATYYVAPTGNDSAPGTESKPWKRIQKAANTAKAGDIVLVRGGIYNERVTINVSGSPDGGYITFKNFEGEVATLDGTGLIVPDADNGMFLIKNQSYITVQGFEIRDYKTAVRYRVPIGINIRGTSHHIKILKNKIHHIETNYPGKDGGDAHGIAVYGTSATSPIRDLIIEANELYALKLGSSEALVLNGNVSNFQVRWNKIHDCNNIGIDFIGHEKTSATRPRTRRATACAAITWSTTSIPTATLPMGTAGQPVESMWMGERESSSNETRCITATSASSWQANMPGNPPATSPCGAI
jgi:hypothetical protein